jgi:hypothetical protein
MRACKALFGGSIPTPRLDLESTAYSQADSPPRGPNRAGLAEVHPKRWFSASGLPSSIE